MTKEFLKSKDLCAEFLDRISEFREGSLPEDVYLRLEAHRQECTRCQMALREEERIASLMSAIPPVEAPPDFRDRVLRAWRVRRDAVKEAVPASTLSWMQTGLLIVLAILLALPVARASLFSSARWLTTALDRLPPEYRAGIEISFRVPTLAEMGARVQTWEGKLFEWLGEIGSVLAPWTGWMWGALVLCLLLGVTSLWLFKSRQTVWLRKQR